jgi:hypothetical protein
MALRLLVETERRLDRRAWARRFGFRLRHRASGSGLQGSGSGLWALYSGSRFVNHRSGYLLGWVFAGSEELVLTLFGVGQQSCELRVVAKFGGDWIDL